MTDPRKTTVPRSRLDARRARLEALKQRRRETAETTPMPEVIDPLPRRPRAEPGTGFKGKLQARLTAQGAQKFQQRQKMLTKVFKTLTGDVADDTEKVPGTPFTVAGVSAFMDTLRKKAAQEHTKGAGMAAGVINYLTSDDPEARNVAGASVEKLQLIARIATRQGGGKA